MNDDNMTSQECKKSPNVYKSWPKMISLEKLKTLTPLQKLPKNVVYLGKLIVAPALKSCPKSNTLPNLVTLPVMDQMLGIFFSSFFHFPVTAAPIHKHLPIINRLHIGNSWQTGHCNKAMALSKSIHCWTRIQCQSFFNSGGCQHLYTVITLIQMGRSMSILSIFYIHGRIIVSLWVSLLIFFVFTSFPFSFFVEVW